MDTKSSENPSESTSSCESMSSCTSTSSENDSTVEDKNTCESEETCGPETPPEPRSTPPEGRTTPPENNLQRTKRLSDQVMGKSPANKKKGQLSTRELDRAAGNFIAGCSNQKWRNMFNYPGNREKIVLRAGKPEYYDLGTAEERIEAVMIAICGGKEVTK